jgi:HlyD family secretion protein
VQVLSGLNADDIVVTGMQTGGAVAQGNSNETRSPFMPPRRGGGGGGNRRN